jgi:hypothetical protein
MSLLKRGKRFLASAYSNAVSKHLNLDNGTYQGMFTVPHYSERCGWKQFGAKDDAEYEYWWQEACGIVSLRMIMDALRPANATTQQPIFTQIQNAIDNGAYLQKSVDGKTVRIGWIHDKLVAIAKKSDLKGYSAQLTVNAICQAILSKKLIIASVYRPFTRFIDEGAPRKKAGGHLVVISGFTWSEGHCTGLFVADPYDKGARSEPIDRTLFKDIYSGSAIVFYK